MLKSADWTNMSVWIDEGTSSSYTSQAECEKANPDVDDPNGKHTN